MSNWQASEERARAFAEELLGLGVDLYTGRTNAGCASLHRAVAAAITAAVGPEVDALLRELETPLGPLVKELRATVHGLDEQVDTLRSERDAALAEVERLREALAELLAAYTQEGLQCARAKARDALAKVEGAK